MNTYNSRDKFGCQTQALREINKITYQRLKQTLALTSILNFYGTLTENWNNKSIGKHIKIKHINKGSTHTNETLNTITIGIFNRLVKLTSRTKKNAQIRIDEKYQGQAKALIKYNLAPNIFPALKEIWNKADALKLNNDAKQEKRSGGRGRIMYFCIGFSNIWREKIYNII